MNANNSQAMRLFAILCLFIVLCGASCSRTPSKTPATTSRFQSGQVWTFHTPTNELPGAALTVVHVDFDPKEGPIVYIMITGVRYTFWDATNKFYPFSEEAPNRSVVNLLRTNAILPEQNLQDFQQFYGAGQEGIKKGELDKCFNITVAEVLGMERNPKTEEAKRPWWKFWR